MNNRIPIINVIPKLVGVLLIYLSPLTIGAVDNIERECYLLGYPASYELALVEFTEKTATLIDVNSFFQDEMNIYLKMHTRITKELEIEGKKGGGLVVGQDVGIDCTSRNYFVTNTYAGNYMFNKPLQPQGSIDKEHAPRNPLESYMLAICKYKFEHGFDNSDEFEQVISEVNRRMVLDAPPSVFSQFEIHIPAEFDETGKITKLKESNLFKWIKENR